MRTFDLAALVATLARHEVRYVIVGGVAVAAHGYVRATQDLDIVPDPDRANLLRLGHALHELDARLPLAGGRAFSIATDLRRLERRENMTLDTTIGGVDIVQRVPGVPGFEALLADAVDADLLGVPVKICSLPQLRAMKRSTGRAQDRADLENLPPAE